MKRYFLFVFGIVALCMTYFTYDAFKERHSSVRSSTMRKSLSTARTKRHSGTITSLRDDVNRLNKAIKLLDTQIERLSDHFVVPVYEEEDEEDVPRVTRPKQVYPMADSSLDTIFIGLAAYHQRKCSDTLADLFANAIMPKNIYVGVVEVRDDGAASCVAKFQDTTCSLKDWCGIDQLRRRSIKPAKSKGPVYLRYLSAFLYRGEKYFMLLSPSSTFVSGWDKTVITMYTELPAAKSVISYHPALRTNATGNTNGTVATNLLHCNISFSSIGVPFYDAEGFKPQSQKCCVAQPFASVDFLFADANILNEVQFDPNLINFHDTPVEETLLAARLYTRGWDIYSPGKDLAFLNPSSGEKREEAHPSEWVIKRVQYFLEAHANGDPVVHEDNTELRIVDAEDIYGLGVKRNLSTFYSEQFGVDVVKHEVKNSWCNRV